MPLTKGGSKMKYGHTQATQKQLNFAAMLARKVECGGTAQDLVRWHFGVSTSKASKIMSMQTVSEAIDAALKHIA